MQMERVSYSNPELDALCTAYQQVGAEIKELEQKKKELKEIILKSLPADKLITDTYTVTKVRAVHVTTSLEEAKKLGCTETQEVVARDKLKNLAETGFPVPGICVSEYIRIGKPRDN